MLRTPIPSILFLAGLLATALPAQGLLTPEQLLQLKRVGEPALSPDGSKLLYTVRTVDLAADKGVTQVFLANLAAATGDAGWTTMVVTSEGSNMHPMWAPDGRSFACISTRSGSPQVWVHPLQGGKPVQVTDHGSGVSNALWSPDGSHFLFTADVQVDPTTLQRHPDLPKANARIHDDLMVRHWDVWKDGTYSHLFVVPASGGKAVDLMAGERVDTPLKPFGGVEQIAWAPDSRSIVYTARRVGDPEASTDSSLWSVPREGGEHRNLTPDLPGYDQEPCFSPDGRYMAFLSMARAGFEADRVRLMLVDTKDGTRRELGASLDASFGGLAWARDSRSLFATVETLGTTQVFQVGIDDTVRQVTKGRHAITDLEVAPDGSRLHAVRTTMERPAELVVVDVATGGITQRTDENGAVFAKLDLPSVEEEWFEATDGKRIHAWVVKPPQFDPAKRHPFLLFCQGGPQSMVGQGFSFRWNFHLMAARGYVVAAVNRRGLPGFGQAWNDQISGDWGGQAMQDLLAVTDAMQQRPYVDPARSGAVGASFGGYTTYWLMGNAGSRFAAMVSHCGVFDLRSMYGTTEELFFVNWDLGGPYWSSPERAKDYERFSPSSHVRNWKTPLLVIHGERDYRVPLEQGLQAFTAAQVQGVPSRLVTFPEEGHWVLRPQNGVLWHREFFAWLDRWCMPK
ncbi:MAG: Prolyl tripeptidyl peptidase precursor [Planctomycetota bacterium]